MDLFTYFQPIVLSLQMAAQRESRAGSISIIVFYKLSSGTGVVFSIITHGNGREEKALLISKMGKELSLYLKK